MQRAPLRCPDAVEDLLAGRVHHHARRGRIGGILVWWAPIGFELRILDAGAAEIVPHAERDPFALLWRLLREGEGDLVERAPMAAQHRADAPHDPCRKTGPAVGAGV